MHLRGLSIRARILAFQLIVGLVVLALFAAAFVAVHNFRWAMARGALAHRQLAAVTRLAHAADLYSKSIASFLMTGAPAPAALAQQQARIGAEIDALDRVTREETVFLGGGDAAQRAEAARVARLGELYADTNRRYEALLAMQEVGQGAAAMRVFFRDIDRRLTDAFETLIDESIAGEIAEIEAADAEAARLVRLLGWGIGIAAPLIVVAALLAAWLLYRSIVRPIGRLGAAAAAIGRGELKHRIGPLGADELGQLARRFDAMAGEIEAQQALLVAARANLEEDVRARTAELEVANAALTELDRSRVHFLADVSHELRTPLTVLRGEAEVTLRGKRVSAAAYRETLERVLEQAREMARLVEDLMALARAETGEVRFDIAPLDLTAVAADAMREARILARPRDVAIEAAPGAALPIAGDAQRVKQVLMILLDNAVKYSERGGSVHVETRAADGRATVIVRNAAAHLGEEELPRLFDRAYRGRDAGRHGAGSGLGLGIARWLTEKQGGAIALARAGDAVEATISFPLAEAPEAKAAMALETTP